MLPLQFGGAKRDQRAKVNQDNSVYLYNAGESSGDACNECCVGWGSMVRRASPSHGCSLP